MQARRERITEMAKLLLPCVAECERKKRQSNVILIACCMCYALGGGYLVHENTRIINGNEYAILNNLIMITAQENHTSAEAITQRVMAQYRVENLQDLKAKSWKDALRTITAQKHY